MAKSKREIFQEKALEQQSEMLEYAKTFLKSDKMNPVPFTMPEPAKVSLAKAKELTQIALMLVESLEGITVSDAVEALHIARELVSKNYYVMPAPASH